MDDMDDRGDIDRQLELVAGIPAITAILRLLREQTGMRFIGIARVTPERWVMCAVLDEAGFGLVPGDQLDVNTTVCRAQIDRPDTIAFDDALAHPLYSQHPGPALYGFRSHMSVAIHVRGAYFGSLCALDPEPAAISNERVIGMMEGMAALIGRLIEEALSHGNTLQALVDERATSVSREQFLAVVAHDIRNPLSTMRTASEILARSADPMVGRVGMRLRSSAQRMSALIDDLVDFARGRAGSAMPVRLEAQQNIDGLLEDVVQEARDAQPAHEIRAHIRMGCPVRCDPARLQQLLSNLIGNAIAYGAADKPIVVEAFERDGVARIVVTNWGEPILQGQIEQIFSAYARASTARADAGMGLGLHICQLIARAHEGTLSVSSDAQSGTRFEMAWPSACEG
ncbi:GAF domain-containing sensor histidine kinase [Xenophilus arseniciresistens]|uniref:histidine kinase n=1 Tax=Xenophilus arseniciresistens TaxID=1283306 RepID=A0AAE3N7E2_9BURK|nr:GAF domain-containing sensor histidine kinase [Xenophilus arseniciresistens]MDA7416243.1 GAF domain-containing sensor histidine kinase [Xenophilus arseniciresistens]